MVSYTKYILKEQFQSFYRQIFLHIKIKSSKQLSALEKSSN